jgi:hypothetical protein
LGTPGRLGKEGRAETLLTTLKAQLYRNGAKRKKK